MSAVMPDTAGATIGRRVETPSVAAGSGPAPWPAPNTPPAAGSPAGDPPTGSLPELVAESAADRIERSRAKLRSALMDIAHPPKRSSRSAASTGLAGLQAKAGSLLRAVPGAGLVIDVVESWWAQHPLRTVGVVAGKAKGFVEPIVIPIAQRNPYALIVGASVLGALFAASRPWRWMLPALFVGVVPQLASHALRRMPVETWLRMASVFTNRPKAATARARRPITPAGAAL